MLVVKFAEIRSKIADDLGMALAASKETMHANQACYATIVALVGAVACSGNHLLQNEDIQRQAALLSFNNCDELEGYIKDVAVKYMRSQLEQSKAGVGAIAGAAAGPRAAEASPSAGAGPSAYTQTNTQVAGVDEADIVKSDGTRIFVLAGGTALYIVRSWPASQLSRSAKVPIEGFARDLFLVTDANHPSALAPTAVVFSQLHAPYSVAQGGATVPCPLNPWLRACGFPSAFKVTVLDISDEAHPRTMGEYYLPGSYDASRRIGSSIRIVSNDFLRYPETVKWYPDVTPEIYLDRAKLSAAFDKRIRDNEVAIRSASLDQYLPEPATSCRMAASKAFLISAQSSAEQAAPLNLDSSPCQRLTRRLERSRVAASSRMPAWSMHPPKRSTLPRGITGGGLNQAKRASPICTSSI